jgi:hypothetical protein
MRAPIGEALSDDALQHESCARDRRAPQRSRRYCGTDAAVGRFSRQTILLIEFLSSATGQLSQLKERAMVRIRRPGLQGIKRPYQPQITKDLTEQAVDALEAIAHSLSAIDHNLEVLIATIKSVGNKLR